MRAKIKRFTITRVQLCAQFIPPTIGIAGFIDEAGRVHSRQIHAELSIIEAGDLARQLSEAIGLARRSCKFERAQP